MWQGSLCSDWCDLHLFLRLICSGPEQLKSVQASVTCSFSDWYGLCWSGLKGPVPESLKFAVPRDRAQQLGLSGSGEGIQETESREECHFTSSGSYGLLLSSENLQDLGAGFSSGSVVSCDWVSLEKGFWEQNLQRDAILLAGTDSGLCLEKFLNFILYIFYWDST